MPKGKILIVTVVTLLSGMLPSLAQRRYDRGYDLSSPAVFAPKGSWMAGGTASYSLHNNRNYSFAVLEGINTTDTSTFVDYSTDESTIALGEAVMTADAENSTNVWQQITIPLEYRNTNVYPTHIIISFAASYYGDYFTGYDNSQLWVDNVELLYE